MGTLRRGVAFTTMMFATGLAMLAGTQMPVAMDNTYHPRHFRNRKPTYQVNKAKDRAEKRKKNKAARKARTRNRS